VNKGWYAKGPGCQWGASFQKGEEAKFNGRFDAGTFRNLDLETAPRSGMTELAYPSHFLKVGTEMSSILKGCGYPWHCVLS
jgi:hypothetical protein